MFFHDTGLFNKPAYTIERRKKAQQRFCSKEEQRKRKRVTVGNCLPQIDGHCEKQAKMKESFIVGRGFLT